MRSVRFICVRFCEHLAIAALVGLVVGAVFVAWDQASLAHKQMVIFSLR